VYATAFELGGFHQATVLIDEPATFLTRGQPPYEPRNWDDQFAGLLTVRENLNQSRNIPAVKALEAASAEAVAPGARARLRRAAVLLAGARVLRGHAAPARLRLRRLRQRRRPGRGAPGRRVEDADGNVLYEAQPRRKQVWTPADRVPHARRAARQRGRPRPDRAVVARLGPGRWLTGKTGTTNDERDIWFVGATPAWSPTVWIGNDDNSSLPRTMTNADGTTRDGDQLAPADLRVERLRRARCEGRPVTSDGFPVPEGIVFHRIDRRTGALSERGTPAAFRADHRPGRRRRGDGR
jgi:penicillin-binding protein 1A